MPNSGRSTTKRTTGKLTPIHKALQEELVYYITRKGYYIRREQRYDQIMDTTRKWRADFYIPKLNILIEINGSKWTKGIHTYGNPLDDNLEKHNTASFNGYILLQFTYDMLKDYQYKKYIA